MTKKHKKFVEEKSDALRLANSIADVQDQKDREWKERHKKPEVVGKTEGRSKPIRTENLRKVKEQLRIRELSAKREKFRVKKHLISERPPPRRHAMLPPDNQDTTHKRPPGKRRVSFA
ncbi:hypothetical protein BD410DRAFT_842512 [Rickenella mellea]|uniref:Uncharacterized protein n=1 Tax=Rickenella mellea TaxID=50990 RepID=A0A4Y7PV86_9AGAM|nr:hypothetical protein BD410DRAFT_842512 [Rickenella mellea]